MTSLKKVIFTFLALMLAATVSGCSPEVGSDAWCADLKEKPKGDWSVNEATDYTKHCLLK